LLHVTRGTMLAFMANLTFRGGIQLLSLGVIGE
jgi:hypothetical protein